jgi:uncharacterized protein YndB with AHSA1/START domain
MPDILHLVKIHASPERVYQALTTAEGIRHWWTRDAVLDSKGGGTGEFGFQDNRTMTRVRIDELEPPVRVAWTTISLQREGTMIMFDLRLERSDTVLSFAHRGFEQVNEGFKRATVGWGHYLGSLQRYLEIGEGTPRG